MSEEKKPKAKREPKEHAHECGGCGGCGAHGAHHEPPDWENIAKYKAAELDNYIKRTKDAVQNAFNDGRIHVLMTILPIGDSLGEALKTVQNKDDRKGLEILLSKFEGTLTALGMEELPVKIGDAFDPHIHQSITECECGENKIAEIYQKGYKFAGRIIRPAMVRV